MEVSKLFVVTMGMGTTFVGLICIIFLTQIMGWVMQRFAKPVPPPPAPKELPKVERAPGVPADGVPNDVKVAIIAALMQQPGFRMEDVTNITIRRL